jgi:quinol monooxygenase YgiN
VSLFGLPEWNAMPEIVYKSCSVVVRTGSATLGREIPAVATFLARIRVRHGETARFEQIARDLYAASHDTETALSRYEYWRGEEPDVYYTLASFDSYPGFLAHQTSPHHEKASPALREVIEDIHLEWVDPIAGASPLAPTVMTDPGDEASETEKAYAKRFDASAQPWWLDMRDQGRGIAG